MPIYESVISGPHHRAVSHSLQGLRDIWGALEIARDHGRLPPDFAIGEWGRMVVPGDVIVDIIQGEPRVPPSYTWADHAIAGRVGHAAGRDRRMVRHHPARQPVRRRPHG